MAKKTRGKRAQKVEEAKTPKRYLDKIREGAEAAAKLIGSAANHSRESSSVHSSAMNATVIFQCSEDSPNVFMTPSWNENMEAFVPRDRFDAETAVAYVEMLLHVRSIMERKAEELNAAHANRNPRPLWHVTARFELRGGNCMVYPKLQGGFEVVWVGRYYEAVRGAPELFKTYDTLDEAAEAVAEFGAAAVSEEIVLSPAYAGESTERIAEAAMPKWIKRTFEELGVDWHVHDEGTWLAKFPSESGFRTRMAMRSFSSASSSRPHVYVHMQDESSGRDVLQLRFPPDHARLPSMIRAMADQRLELKARCDAIDGSRGLRRSKGFSWNDLRSGHPVGLAAESLDGMEWVVSESGELIPEMGTASGWPRRMPEGPRFATPEEAVDHSLSMGRPGRPPAVNESATFGAPGALAESGRADAVVWREMRRAAKILGGTAKTGPGGGTVTAGDIVVHVSHGESVSFAAAKLTDESTGLVTKANLRRDSDIGDQIVAYHEVAVAVDAGMSKMAAELGLHRLSFSELESDRHADEATVIISAYTEDSFEVVWLVERWDEDDAYFDGPDDVIAALRGVLTEAASDEAKAWARAAAKRAAEELGGRLLSRPGWANWYGLSAGGISVYVHGFSNGAGQPEIALTAERSGSSVGLTASVSLRDPGDLWEQVVAYHEVALAVDAGISRAARELGLAVTEFGRATSDGLVVVRKHSARSVWASMAPGGFEVTWLVALGVDEVAECGTVDEAIEVGKRPRLAESSSELQKLVAEAGAMAARELGGAIAPHQAGCSIAAGGITVTVHVIDGTMDPIRYSASKANTTRGLIVTSNLKDQRDPHELADQIVAYHEVALSADAGLERIMARGVGFVRTSFDMLRNPEVFGHDDSRRGGARYVQAFIDRGSFEVAWLVEDWDGNQSRHDGPDEAISSGRLAEADEKAPKWAAAVMQEIGARKYTKGSSYHWFVRDAGPDEEEDLTVGVRFHAHGLCRVLVSGNMTGNSIEFTASADRSRLPGIVAAGIELRALLLAEYRAALAAMPSALKPVIMASFNNPYVNPVVKAIDDYEWMCRADGAASRHETAAAALAELVTHPDVLAESAEPSALDAVADELVDRRGGSADRGSVRVIVRFDDGLGCTMLRDTDDARLDVTAYDDNDRFYQVDVNMQLDGATASRIEGALDMVAEIKRDAEAAIASLPRGFKADRTSHPLAWSVEGPDGWAFARVFSGSGAIDDFRWQATRGIERFKPIDCSSAAEAFAEAAKLAGGVTESRAVLAEGRDGVLAGVRRVAASTGGRISSEGWAVTYDDGIPITIHCSIAPGGGVDLTAAASRSRSWAAMHVRTSGRDPEEEVVAYAELVEAVADKLMIAMEKLRRAGDATFKISSDFELVNADGSMQLHPEFENASFDALVWVVTIGDFDPTPAADFDGALKMMLDELAPQDEPLAEATARGRDLAQAMAEAAERFGATAGAFERATFAATAFTVDRQLTVVAFEQSPSAVKLAVSRTQTYVSGWLAHTLWPATLDEPPRDKLADMIVGYVELVLELDGVMRSMAEELRPHGFDRRGGAFSDSLVMPPVTALRAMILRGFNVAYVLTTGNVGNYTSYDTREEAVRAAIAAAEDQRGRVDESSDIESDTDALKAAIEIAAAQSGSGATQNKNGGSFEASGVRVKAMAARGMAGRPLVILYSGKRQHDFGMQMYMTPRGGPHDLAEQLLAYAEVSSAMWSSFDAQYQRLLGRGFKNNGASMLVRSSRRGSEVRVVYEFVAEFEAQISVVDDWETVRAFGVDQDEEAGALAISLVDARLTEQKIARASSVNGACAEAARMLGGREHRMRPQFEHTAGRILVDVDLRGDRSAYRLRSMPLDETTPSLPMYLPPPEDDGDLAERFVAYAEMAAALWKSLRRAERALSAHGFVRRGDSLVCMRPAFGQPCVLAYSIDAPFEPSIEVYLTAEYNGRVYGIEEADEAVARAEGIVTGRLKLREADNDDERVLLLGMANRAVMDVGARLRCRTARGDVKTAPWYAVGELKVHVQPWGDGLGTVMLTTTAKPFRYGFMMALDTIEDAADLTDRLIAYADVAPKIGAAIAAARVKLGAVDAIPSATYGFFRIESDGPQVTVEFGCTAFEPYVAVMTEARDDRRVFDLDDAGEAIDYAIELSGRRIDEARWVAGPALVEKPPLWVTAVADRIGGVLEPLVGRTGSRDRCWRLLVSEEPRLAVTLCSNAGKLGRGVRVGRGNGGYRLALDLADGDGRLPDQVEAMIEMMVALEAEYKAARAKHGYEHDWRFADHFGIDGPHVRAEVSSIGTHEWLMIDDGSERSKLRFDSADEAFAAFAGTEWGRPLVEAKSFAAEDEEIRGGMERAAHELGGAAWVEINKYSCGYVTAASGPRVMVRKNGSGSLLLTAYQDGMSGAPMVLPLGNGDIATQLVSYHELATIAGREVESSSRGFLDSRGFVPSAFGEMWHERRGIVFGARMFAPFEITYIVEGPDGAAGVHESDDAGEAAREAARRCDGAVTEGSAAGRAPPKWVLAVWDAVGAVHGFSNNLRSGTSWTGYIGADERAEEWISVDDKGSHNVTVVREAEEGWGLKLKTPKEERAMLPGRAAAMVEMRLVLKAEYLAALEEIRADGTRAMRTSFAHARPKLESIDDVRWQDYSGSGADHDTALEAIKASLKTNLAESAADDARALKLAAQIERALGVVPRVEGRYLEVETGSERVTALVDMGGVLLMADEPGAADDRPTGWALDTDVELGPRAGDAVAGFLDLRRAAKAEVEGCDRPGWTAASFAGIKHGCGAQVKPHCRRVDDFEWGVKLPPGAPCDISGYSAYAPTLHEAMAEAERLCGVSEAKMSDDFVKKTVEVLRGWGLNARVWPSMAPTGTCFSIVGAKSTSGPDALTVHMYRRGSDDAFMYATRLVGRDELSGFSMNLPRARDPHELADLARSYAETAELADQLVAAAAEELRPHGFKRDNLAHVIGGDVDLWARFSDPFDLGFTVSVQGSGTRPYESREFPADQLADAIAHAREAAGAIAEGSRARRSKRPRWTVPEARIGKKNAVGEALELLRDSGRTVAPGRSPSMERTHGIVSGGRGFDVALCDNASFDAGTNALRLWTIGTEGKLREKSGFGMPIPVRPGPDLAETIESYIESASIAMAAMDSAEDRVGLEAMLELGIVRLGLDQLYKTSTWADPAWSKLKVFFRSRFELAIEVSWGSAAEPSTESRRELEMDELAGAVDLLVRGARGRADEPVLTELFDSSYPFERTEAAEADAVRYSFEVPGAEGAQPSKLLLMLKRFAGAGRGEYSVALLRMAPEGHYTYATGIYGSGAGASRAAIRVLGTVVACIKDFVALRSPRTISFIGMTAEHDELYKMMFERLKRAASGMGYDAKVSCHRVFTLTKKRTLLQRLGLFEAAGGALEEAVVEDNLAEALRLAATFMGCAFTERTLGRAGSLKPSARVTVVARMNGASAHVDGNFSDGDNTVTMSYDAGRESAHDLAEKLVSLSETALIVLDRLERAAAELGERTGAAWDTDAFRAESYAGMRTRALVAWCRDFEVTWQVHAGAASGTFDDADLAVGALVDTFGPGLAESASSDALASAVQRAAADLGAKSWDVRGSSAWIDTDRGVVYADAMGGTLKLEYLSAWCVPRCRNPTRGFSMRVPIRDGMDEAIVAYASFAASAVEAMSEAHEALKSRFCSWHSTDLIVNYGSMASADPRPHGLRFAARVAAPFELSFVVGSNSEESVSRIARRAFDDLDEAVAYAVEVLGG